ncbi:MAG: FHA domain-containing protein, partial [Deltaproteobacteria bacterium]|nr:FHA domain-containing protein [Deltaproteobacteria bacterium]
DPQSLQPFESLAPRASSTRVEPPRPRFRASAPRDDVSSIITRLGPIQVGADEVLQAGEVPAGRLTLHSPEGHERLAVGFAALDRGVVLGRSTRCAGHEALSEDGISRVHAILLRRDGTIFLADAGSKNGTWQGETELRCTRLVPKTEYRLGLNATLKWEPG